MVRRRRREAASSDAQLAPVLEQFAVDCAKVISTNELHWRSGGHEGTETYELRAPPTYPADVEWRAMDPSLAATALSFPNEVKLGRPWFGDPNLLDDEILELVNHRAGLQLPTTPRGSLRVAP